MEKGYIGVATKSALSVAHCASGKKKEKKKYLSPEINTQHSIERDQNGGWVKNTWQVL